MPVVLLTSQANIDLVEIALRIAEENHGIPYAAIGLRPETHKKIASQRMGEYIEKIIHSRFCVLRQQ